MKRKDSHQRDCNDIRREFLAFFEDRGHTFVPSSSLLPADDPTLLFANAGMNQFKGIFLGTESREYRRAVNSQKCIRAGGKHNDLEDVGHDTYHHTFFEMLGNWSFGDYFKAEAIGWAWELLTDVWKLPKERLYATVFEGDAADGLEPDDESHRLWAEVTDIDPSHVFRAGRKDNFWAPAETGPCGPCSEIHIDLTEDLSGGKRVNAGDPRVIELWNLVFIQFNRDAEGGLWPLPAKHVDTGMGFERICAVLQGKRSNYASDLFTPLIRQIETLTSHRYGAGGDGDDRFDVQSGDDIGDVACRVVADHARALTFAISDGVIPSNEGRGYVLRRILRRAARYGRQYLGIEGAFLVELVPTIVEMMGESFPETRDRRNYVMETIREEEQSFGRTLDRGIALFQRQAEGLCEAGQSVLPGEVAFELYATYGFPVDLTQIMAAERGLTVDIEGYDRAMARHREVSGAGEAFKAEDIPSLPPTDDSAKYGIEPIEARVLGWVAEGRFVGEGTLSSGAEAAVVLDRTSFYAEAGGQVGDAGHLVWPDGRFAVRDTQPAGDSVLHRGVVEAGTLAAGATVTCEVDPSRMDTMRNHSATHLLNWALRRVLGPHVNQAGSVVAPDRLRFDFTHNRAMSAEQLAEVERLVNERVLADEPVRMATTALAEAQRIPGIRAVFGERYPDPVRVVTMGGRQPVSEADESRVAELCGGTHLERTSQVGLFKIVSEESVAKGVRRITALTGREACRWVRQAAETLGAVTAALCVPTDELADRVLAMQREIKELRKRPAKAADAGGPLEVTDTIEAPEGRVLIARAVGADAAAMRNVCDQQRQRGAAAILLGGQEQGKATLVAMVSDELARTGKIKAGDWVKAVAPIVGGGGGGKATLAQAGGKQGRRLAEALSAAADWARQRLT
jgi:alanyl-tRNA synthetase